MWLYAVRMLSLDKITLKYNILQFNLHFSYRTTYMKQQVISHIITIYSVCTTQASWLYALIWIVAQKCSIYNIMYLKNVIKIALMSVVMFHLNFFWGLLELHQLNH